MILADLSEEEAYLYALFQDESGIDQAELCLIDETTENGLFRAWPIQHYWWTDPSPLSLSQGSRSVGKSLSLKMRAFAFPFILPGEEMVVTAPEGGHLDAVMDNIETLFTQNRIAEGMLAPDARGRIKHRPWMINFASGGRILGKIPKHDGSGVRGIHPIWLEHDEACFDGGSPVDVLSGIFPDHETIQVPISSIRRGDYVKNFSGFKKVLEVHNHGPGDMITLSLADGRTITCTPNHSFMQEERLWREAQFIDYVVNSDGSHTDVVGRSDAGKRERWDLTVEEDPSYTVYGALVHNSFYPEAGWVEIIETVKIQHPKARWRSHGVTVGPGNTFDDIISGSKGDWTVNSLPAMYRPNWTEEERQQKIKQYGSVDSVDYQRNVHGTSGDGSTALVVLHRLMSCVDQDSDSDFNQDYFNCEFDEAQVREVEDISDLVDPPISHMQYKKIWMGMDFGLTTSASCIVIFAEVKRPKESYSRLEMIGKVTMLRVSTEDQVRVIMHLMALYRPTSFAFDAHGVGQPAFEWLQKEVRDNKELAWMIDRVVGYSFSKKMIVGFDDNIEIRESDPEGWRDAAIEKLGSEASLDSLRYLVDTKQVHFPFDKPMIGEIRAVPRQEKRLLDEYGKPKRKTGQHTLDALRFVFLAYTQKDIDAIIAMYEQDTWQAPDMIILDDLF